jgi:GxxExxY protein
MMGAQRGAGSHRPLDERTEPVAREIVDAAFKVHVALGPGLLESVYERCICHELANRGMRFRRQVELPIVYGDITIRGGLRLDLLVEDLVICELKAVEAVPTIALTQLLTSLRLADKRLGFIINFNVARIMDGIKRVIH